MKPLKNRLFMRKLFLSLLLGVCCTFAQAQVTRTYTDDLTVTIDGESAPAQKTDILITDNGDGTYNMDLKNFCLSIGEETMYVGNISLQNIAGEKADGYTAVNVKQTIRITEGDLEEAPYWVGPALKDVPIDFKGKLTDDKMYCSINIDMTDTPLGQLIYVVFGTDNFPASSIKNTKNESTHAAASVYTLQGILVKSNVSEASALEGLPKGIYIVNGKKMVRK